MFGLTPMARPVGMTEVSQTAFGGYDHRVGAGDGSLWDTMNLSADRYPALTVRPRRGLYTTVRKPNGFFVRDCIAWVDGTKLVVDGVEAAELTDGPKEICGIQKKLCVWPDKVIYDRETGELTPMEASWEGQGSFSDGTYAGEPALANTITVDGDITRLFRAGDGVTVQTGGVTDGAFVIQEIEYDTDRDETELRFLEETWREFVEEPTDSELPEGMEPLPNVGMKTAITIKRTAPELVMAFEHHNRIWGVKGNTIYASKLGDPANWQVFDGLSTDSYELTLGSPGDITGCCAHLGRPVFFKEQEIIKIYGDTPDTFQTSSVTTLGVEQGSGKSLAVAGETLFFKSPAGVRAYNGGYSWDVSEAFGDVRYRNAVAGSDGIRYYAAMENGDGEWGLFVYDTRYRLWHREDGARMVGFGYNGDLFGLDGIGFLHVLGSPRNQAADEEGISSWAEFADFSDGTTLKKGMNRLTLRLEVDDGATLRIRVQYDSDGVWHTVGQVNGKMVKGQIELPVVIRRCDHYRIRLEGTGMGGCGWTLYALTRQRRAGSNKK